MPATHRTIVLPQAIAAVVPSGPSGVLACLRRSVCDPRHINRKVFIHLLAPSFGGAWCPFANLVLACRPDARTRSAYVRNLVHTACSQDRPERALRVDLTRCPSLRRMMGWTVPRTASACQDGRCQQPI